LQPSHEAGVRSRVIAIAGAKGSPGCSFLAVALARCLAANNIATLLLDGDGEGGGLAAMLDVGSTSPSDLIATSAVEQPAMQIEKELWFAELDGLPSEHINGLHLAGAARVRHQAVVIDLGHSAGPIQRQLSAASDWLLWVVVPDRSGLERAERGLAAGVLGAASSGLVFNRIKRGCLERADEVLSSRHRMPVMARINEDRRLAHQLSLGRPVHRDRALRRTLRELARSVHPDVGSAARRWL
jgi:MinD-like ATPase involved in chromosome partitioning or flagellar assembly